MEVFKVKEHFDISHLHFLDGKYWKRLHDLLVQQYPTEEVLIDFKGIQLINAWESEYFVNMVRHENFYFKVYFNATLVEAVDLLCKSNVPVLKTGRVENYQPTEKIEKPKFVISETEIKSVQDGITSEDGELHVKYCYSAIERKESILALQQAIRNAFNGESKIVINLQKVIVQKTMIKELYGITVELECELGTPVTCINMLKQKDFDMCVKFGPNIDMNKLSLEDRITILTKHLPRGSVAILVKYKDKRGAKDAFNVSRQWSRYARFDGIVNGKAKFTTFRQDSFHTQYHLKQEQLNYSKVESVPVFVPVDKLGFWDFFLGEDYHVNFAVQFDKSKSHGEWYIDCDGDTCYQQFTIPDYIELVMEEYELPYNKEHLQDCRENTYRFLGISSSDDL